MAAAVLSRSAQYPPFRTRREQRSASAIPAGPHERTPRIAPAPAPAPRQVWAVQPDGSRLRQLTSPASTGVSLAAHPTYSPDGRLLAFSGQRGANLDIYVAPARGGGAPRRLTNATGGRAALEERGAGHRAGGVLGVTSRGAFSLSLPRASLVTSARRHRRCPCRRHSRHSLRQGPQQ